MLLTVLLVAMAHPCNAAAEGEKKQEAIRRFALLAASNDGGPSRVELRYAHTDATAMTRVLRQLGGVSPNDSVLLFEPDRFDFEAGLARIRQRLEGARNADTRLELIFYYSGHSDEQGLMLGTDLISYRELRDQIAKLPADVRIAILDSCSSGALTRGKGGKRRAPFLLDTSVDVQGHAFLTSSSADESAQESDRVGGSFFTHYLVSGLRGAADTSQDGKVTLNEAYQYAFDETLSRTESTQGGPQHPNYDFQLKGSGDLVLTDLRGTSALLVLSPSLVGRLFIRNDKGQLIAEINKLKDKPVSIGLEPGEYEITLEKPAEFRKGIIALSEQTPLTLNADQLTIVEQEQAVARGTQPNEAPAVEEPVSDKIVRRPFSVNFVPGVGTDMNVEGNVRNNFSLNFVGGGNYLTGLEFGHVGNIRSHNVFGAQVAGIFNSTLGETRGFQWAGIFNYSGRAHVGFQGAGIANVVQGPVIGFQGAGIANVNTNGSSLGFQAAGIANVNHGSSTGFQGAGIANVNRGFTKGFQGAGIANVSMTDHSQGFQGAGIVNVAESIKGAQVAGIANVAYRDLLGFQAGLVNYGGNVRGVQLGLINVSCKNSGAPIGLVNAVGDGMLAPTYWLSDTSLVNVGIKMGSRHVYSILGYGYNPLRREDGDRHAVIAGIGGHIDFSPVWLELDLVHRWLFSRSDWSDRELDKNDIETISKVRAIVGFRIVPQFSVYVGPTFNFYISDDDREISFLPRLDRIAAGDELDLYFGIGGVLGIQWTPQWGNLNDPSAK